MATAGLKAALQTNIRRQRSRLQTSSSSDTGDSKDLDSSEYSYDSNDLNTPGVEENVFPTNLFHRIAAYT